MRQRLSSDQSSRRRILIAASAVLLFGGLLLLDLRFHGLAWQFFYSQTGEESIVGQIRGMVEVAGNLTRVQPVTDPYAPIQHADLFPYGINTFFDQETEPDKMRVQMRMIADAGFGWIRQEFPWEDIEVDGRGQFTDSRNDYNQDGIPDTISAWDKYDRIVALAEEFNLGLLIRLSNPPNWSRAVNTDSLGGSLQPPDDYQDFVNFALAVAERYQGRIRYYQIWNEPNIYPEWGEQFADPVAYTDLLCRTYRALKAFDPSLVIISGTIAPTKSLDGYYGYQDLVYLTAMYDAGAGECFDVLSAQGYGLFSGPTDRRFRATYLNFARHVAYRDLMIEYGDAHKPIWLSEVAWNPVLDAFLPPEQITQYANFGVVTNDQAARFLQGAYQRIREEWPWVGNVSYWHFTRPTIEQANQAFYWFRMVEADYSPQNPTFTPLPVYYAAQDYIRAARENPVLYRGTHQAESWEIAAENSARMPSEGAQFDEALRTSGATWSSMGTGLRIRVRAAEPLFVVRDGTFYEAEIPASDDWQSVTVFQTWLPEQHHFSLESSAPFELDSITVLDDRWRNVLPLLTLGFAFACFLLIEIVRAVRFRLRG
jgi:hypothetical protein